MVEPEAPQVGGEHQQAVGREAPHALADELGVVALDVQRAAHALGIRLRLNPDDLRLVVARVDRLGPTQLLAAATADIAQPDTDRGQVDVAVPGRVRIMAKPVP